MSYKRFGRFYGFLQILVPISFFFYFRKKQIVKFQNIPKRAPIIFAPNHQNTLMDPFVTSIYSRRQTGFLARASAFKNPLVARILNWLKMKPVYRPRDGMENLIKNDEVFKACYEVLSMNMSFIMFPEGSHNRKRHLRLFKKGFTRIALGAMEESDYQLKVKIVPVGLNYSDHLYQGGDLLVIFGKPIEVADYIELYKENQPKAINKLKIEIHEKTKELIIHIDDEEHYEMIDSLREIYRLNMIESLNLRKRNLFDQFNADKRTIEKIEKHLSNHLNAAEQIDNNIKEYKSTLYALKLKESIFYKNNKSFIIAILNSLLLLISSPIFAFSIINGFVPYYIIRFIIKHQIHDDHFYTAFKSTIGMFLFPIFYMLITIPVILLFNIKIGLIYYLGLFITAKITLMIRLLYRETKVRWIYLYAKHFKLDLFNKLILQRKGIIRIMDNIVEKGS